jgi:CubicO group peptidase (beta-lactamase class C family)
MLLFRLLALRLVASAASPPVSIGDVYNGSLNLATEVETFRHIEKLFPSRTVPHGAPSPLRSSSRPLQSLSFTSAGQRVTLDEYLELNRVAGLLVLKNGQIALERYRFGNTDRTRWVSWSVVKSITSTLVGAAIRDGHIRSLDDPITNYLPRLTGTAWDGVSVRHVLQMSSGVRWNETYTDPRSDRRRMLNVHLQQQPGSILEFLPTLPRSAAPGTVWNYSTGETHILGTVLRAAVKRPLATYLSEKIWSKFAMESDATWWLESPDGLEIGGSGFSATLRDYGRFALFVLNGGKAAGQQVVPVDWFPGAGMPKQVGRGMVNYGYMWWSFGADSHSVHDGAFYALGIFGQYIYVNPRQRVAIVVWSARPKPTGSSPVSDYDFFTATVAALNGRQ